MKILAIGYMTKTNPIQSRTNPIYLAPSTAGGLKKQSQFAGQANRRKLLYERRLWQYTALPVNLKQSQFKASVNIGNIFAGAKQRPVQTTFEIRPTLEKRFYYIIRQYFRRLFLLMRPKTYFAAASATQHPLASALTQQPPSTQHGFGQGIGQGLSQQPSSFSPEQHGFGQPSVHGVLGQPVDSACIADIWGHAAIFPVAGQHPTFVCVSVSAD
jgi:hypothetical protein